MVVTLVAAGCSSSFTTVITYELWIGTSDDDTSDDDR